MAHRLQVEELSDGRIAVGLLRSGQSFLGAVGDPVAFNSPFGEGKSGTYRWYLEDYLMAPYAVYEERGRRRSRARLRGWGEALFEALVRRRQAGPRCVPASARGGGGAGLPVALAELSRAALGVAAGPRARACRWRSRCRPSTARCVIAGAAVTSRRVRCCGC